MDCALLSPCVRTSLCYFGKSQAGGPLKVDIVGKDKRTQGSERLAGEEIGLAALWFISLRRLRCGERERVITHVFEVLEEIGNGLALTVSEDGFV